MTPSDMPEKVSAELLREIVDGCEGVTPGPYSINHGSENHHHCRVFDDEGHEVMRTEWDKGLNAHRNISHFARLDPATVRSIGLELIEARALIDTLQRERDELRRIISECASATGAGIAPTASIEFMATLPEEIRLGRDRLQRERDEAVRIAKDVSRALTGLTPGGSELAGHSK